MRQTYPEGEVMTFKEIGERLGISPQRAEQACNSGLKKLREYHFEFIWKLHQLSNDRQKLRAKNPLPETE